MPAQLQCSCSGAGKPGNEAKGCYVAAEYFEPVIPLSVCDTSVLVPYMVVFVY